MLCVTAGAEGFTHPVPSRPSSVRKLYDGEFTSALSVTMVLGNKRHAPALDIVRAVHSSRVSALDVVSTVHSSCENGMEWKVEGPLQTFWVMYG